MKIAYIDKSIYGEALFQEMKKHFEVKRFSDFCPKADECDVVFVEFLGIDAQSASKHHKNVIVRMRGVEVYEQKESLMNQVDWKNITLLGLSQHQIDYFKRRWPHCHPKRFGVLPLNAMLDQFTLRKNPEKNNKVALIANITGRKGIDQIPEFLNKFPELHIYHLGKVCAYGAPVFEFVRWRLERDGNADRYHYEKHVPHEKLNNWLEDKTYIWLPSVAEGFNRSLLEGMCKGLMPLIRKWPGAQDIWPESFLYNELFDLWSIFRIPYVPNIYRGCVENRYSPEKIIKQLKTFL